MIDSTFSSALTSHRHRIRKVVRSVVPRPHIREGEHVASIGLLLAMRKHPAEDATAPDFWYHAYWIVREEITKWLSTGVYWRKPANRSADPARVAARERAAASLMHGELDPNVACTRSTPEEDFAGAEVRSIVRRILSEVRSPREAKAKIKKRLQ